MTETISTSKYHLVMMMKGMKMKPRDAPQDVPIKNRKGAPGEVKGMKIIQLGAQDILDQDLRMDGMIRRMRETKRMRNRKQINHQMNKM